MSVPAVSIVKAAKHEYVLTQTRDRRQARSNVVIGAFFRWDPITLRDAVAVEPQDVSLLRSAVQLARPLGLRGVGCSGRVKHRHKRRYAYDDTRVGSSQAAEKEP